jgi:hypothetical protein
MKPKTVAKKRIILLTRQSLTAERVICSSEQAFCNTGFNSNDQNHISLYVSGG